MKKQPSDDNDSDIFERAKTMTREEMEFLAEELERRAAIWRQVACDGIYEEPFVLQHVRRSLRPEDLN